MSQGTGKHKVMWSHYQHTWQILWETVHDISIPLHFSGKQPEAFGISAATAWPLRAGEFIGSLQEGGSVNCYTLQMTPHGNGTHTETALHVFPQAPDLSTVSIPAWLLCLVVSVPLTQRMQSQDTYLVPSTPDDQWITRSDLEQATLPLWFSGVEALVIRTLPNDPQKQQMRYSGQHPGYLSLEAMAWVRTQQIQHLLVDLPSVDREEDQGKLPNHRIFWENDWQRTITEMVYVDNSIPDGLYLLNLQVPRFCLDAAPSRPVLFGLSSFAEWTQI